MADLLMEGNAFNRSRPWAKPKASPAARGVPDLTVEHSVTSVAMRLVSLVVYEASRSRALQRAKSGDYAVTRELMQRASALAGLLGPQRRVRSHAGKEWIAAALLSGLGREPTEEAVRAVDAALIMSAEHELAPPTVAVRIAASTGADISSCLIAGLVTDTGRLQAGGIEAAEDVMYRIAGGSRRSISVGWFEDRARLLPWTSHPLYGRDPRAAMLIELARSMAELGGNNAVLWKFMDKLGSTTTFSPNTGFALVVLSLALGLPKRSAFLIRLIGRMSGWAAHAGEQRSAGFMMRPRAKFI